MGKNMARQQISKTQIKQARAKLREHLALEEQREKKRAERPHKCMGCVWGRNVGGGKVHCIFGSCVRGRI